MHAISVKAFSLAFSRLITIGRRFRSTVIDFSEAIQFYRSVGRAIQPINNYMCLVKHLDQAIVLKVS